MEMKIIIIILTLLCLAELSAEELFTARVYHRETGEFLYWQYNQVTSTDSTVTQTHNYLHADSTLAVVDEVVLKNGIPWKFYSKFYDIGEESLIILEDDFLQINYWENGEQKSKAFEFEDRLLSGPLFNDFVQEKWNSLLQGEVEKFRLPAADMLTTGGFYLKQVDGSEYKKKGTVVFKMGISSIFLRLWIKPSYFVYDLENKQLLEIHGLTILPNKVDDDWSRTTNADIFYEYKK
jgi:hypothetical protein